MVQLKDLLGTLELCSGIHTKIFQDHIQFFDLIPLDGNIYNQVGMLNDMGFPNFQKGEPINVLMREVKKDLKAQKKAKKIGWKDFLEFWPMSIWIMWDMQLQDNLEQVF